MTADAFVFPGEDDSIGGDEFESWQERMIQYSGEWESVSPQCSAVLDFRILKFGSSNVWHDLDGQRFLLGQSMDFISSDAHYLVELVKEGSGLLRIDRRKVVEPDLPTVVSLQRKSEERLSPKR